MTHASGTSPFSDMASPINSMNGGLKRTKKPVFVLLKPENAFKSTEMAVFVLLT